MWTIPSEKLDGDRGLRFRVDQNERRATYADVVEAWEHEDTFRSQFLTLLADAPYAAYRWETPAVTESTWDRSFEFVLLDSPSLARRPEPDAFAEHFGEPNADVISFQNLGGDAVLVVPTKRASDDAYGHLAAFVRHAPEQQQHALWQRVAVEMKKRVGAKPVWLSTAGAGVSWLHVRLDDRPKYYGWREYAKT